MPKMECPTCGARTLPAVECPLCKSLNHVDTTFVSCSVCHVSVCPQCIFVIYSTTDRPTCHRCNAKKEESSDA